MEYYLAIETNTTVISMRWVVLEPVGQSGVSQKEQKTNIKINGICGTQKGGSRPCLQGSNGTQREQTAWCWEVGRRRWMNPRAWNMHAIMCKTQPVWICRGNSGFKPLLPDNLVLGQAGRGREVQEGGHRGIPAHSCWTQPATVVSQSDTVKQLSSRVKKKLLKKWHHRTPEFIGPTIFN